MAAQQMVYTRPVKKIYQALVETEFACPRRHVCKIQAILYHSANRKRERIVPPQKMFKHSSPSCRHQQHPKSPKTSSPFVHQ